jgi:hypothetical protein
MAVMARRYLSFVCFILHALNNNIIHVYVTFSRVPCLKEEIYRIVLHIQPIVSVISLIQLVENT